MSEYRSGSWNHPGNVSDFISPTGTDSFGWNPAVAMGNGGDTVIAWSQFGSDGLKQIFISEYRYASRVNIIGSVLQNTGPIFILAAGYIDSL